MKLRVVLPLLGGLGVAGLFALEQSPDGNAATAARIVQAPPTAANGKTAAGSGSSTSDSGSQNDGDRVAVGFTTVGGKLYLVTAENAGATRLFRDTTVAGKPLGFQCAAGSPGDFAAWELRSYGGSGSLPPLSKDGRLLTAQPDGSRLPCTLTEVEQK
ncbi:hypothetical protein [Amycolatopsis pigmentata]|uniref:Secreted protein n=1 Tax=Amycolatopsis pigmentata TaxID=450801 RepID=A0ABW5G0S4_9PSEU